MNRAQNPKCFKREKKTAEDTLTKCGFEPLPVSTFFIFKPSRLQ